VLHAQADDHAGDDHDPDEHHFHQTETMTRHTRPRVIEERPGKKNPAQIS
jgi:hypothetical protein